MKLFSAISYEASKYKIQDLTLVMPGPADQHIVLYKAGHLRNEKVREVIRKIVEIVQH